MNREQEIEAVKALGEQIGYGNLMGIASALWAIDLDKSGHGHSGVFLPVCDFSLKSPDRNRSNDALNNRMQEVGCVLTAKKLLNS